MSETEWEEVMVIDGYGDGKERDWGCEMWKEKRELKWLLSNRQRLTLWLFEWNGLRFVCVSIHIKVVINE